MEVVIKENPRAMGEAAGKLAAQQIKDAIANNGQANIILATGTSQLEMINQLLSDKGTDWSKVVMFHLDEYIGLPITHKASFRKYLKERFIEKADGLQDYHLINGEADDPEEETARLDKLIGSYHIDVAMVGIGENGHLAFNDPPANFDTEKPYLVVDLDEKCRRQQMGEGWFKDISDVPPQAISMSIKQILKSKSIICSVPDKRKAEAVRNCLEEPVSNLFPASILRTHGNCSYFLDEASASLLNKENNNS